MLLAPSPCSFRNISAEELFSAAVNSDSFRYILTLAQALNGTNSDEVLLDLPYPYGTGNQNEKI